MELYHHSPIRLYGVAQTLPLVFADGAIPSFPIHLYGVAQTLPLVFADGAIPSFPHTSLWCGPDTSPCLRRWSYTIIPPYVLWCGADTSLVFAASNAISLLRSSALQSLLCSPRDLVPKQTATACNRERERGKEGGRLWPRCGIPRPTVWPNFVAVEDYGTTLSLHLVFKKKESGQRSHSDCTTERVAVRVPID
jgi:hypothetical protein